MENFLLQSPEKSIFTGKEEDFCVYVCARGGLTEEEKEGK